VTRRAPVSVEQIAVVVMAETDLPAEDCRRIASKIKELVDRPGPSFDAEADVALRIAGAAHFRQVDLVPPARRLQDHEPTLVLDQDTDPNA
jgi:hypothetical protein